MARFGRLTSALIAGVIVVGCSAENPATESGSTPAGDVTAPDSVDRPPQGGEARVGVWEEPDPDAVSITGAGIRALVLPQMFRATPDGAWEPWLVDGESVIEADDLRSVTFALRPGAVWSDGAEIGAADLARDADQRVVEEITSDGRTITVRFTQPLPGWRDLWSGDAVISPPGPQIFGGPFQVVSRTEGLETVLEPNPTFWGDPPNLDRVSLVYVPDDLTAAQLLAAGELDVISPRAATARTTELRSIAGVEVSTASSTGWWFGAEASPRNSRAVRAGLLASIDGDVFVESLLDGEATSLDGFGTASAAWASPITGSIDDLAGTRLEVTFVDHDPVAGLIHRVLADAAPAATQLDRKAADAETIGAFAVDGDFDLLLAWRVDDPDLCHRCRFSAIDEGLALAADGGDDAAAQQLTARARDDALLLPLWRPVPVVAHRAAVVGPRANGFARIAAWNAETWFKVS